MVTSINDFERHNADYVGVGGDSVSFMNYADNEHSSFVSFLMKTVTLLKRNTLRLGLAIGLGAGLVLGLFRLYFYLTSPNPDSAN